MSQQNEEVIAAAALPVEDQDTATGADTTVDTPVGATDEAPAGPDAPAGEPVADDTPVKLKLPYDIGSWKDAIYDTIPSDVTQEGEQIAVDINDSPTVEQRQIAWLMDRMGMLENLVLQNEQNAVKAMSSMVRSVQTLAGSTMKTQENVNRLTMLIAQLGQGVSSMTSPQVLKVAITDEKPPFGDIENVLSVVKASITSASHPQMPNFVEVLNNKPVDGVDHWDHSTVSQELGIYLNHTLKATGKAVGDWVWVTLWMVPRPDGCLKGVLAGTLDEVPLPAEAPAADAGETREGMYE